MAFDLPDPTPLNSVLTIKGGQRVATISPMFSGLIAEEVNHAFDGGLYGELVQNRIFRDSPLHPVHWFLVQDGTAVGSATLDLDHPINPVLTTSLRLDVKEANDGQRLGIANDGYWGIPLWPKTTYHLSFFARAVAPRGREFKGPITATLESPDGLTCYARGVVTNITGNWQSYSLTLVTGALKPSLDGRLVLSVNDPGQVWFNLVSLFPPTWQNRLNGNRGDLTQKLLDLKPGFLHFPGGNYLEGDSVPTRFDWKRSLHDLPLRAGHPGPWRYRSSDGMGLREFLAWSEELEVPPVLAVYAGYSLGGQAVKAGPDLLPLVQDALDEIEYLIGDESTAWGRQRAVDGHPRPFPLKYVEVGHEDGLDRSGSYSGRFAQFYDAIKGRYPQLQLIATTPVRGRIPDLLDEHFHRSIAETLADLHHFDSYNRLGPKVMVGGWSTVGGGETSSLGAALADAAWWLAMERNADVVVMQGYSPLLENVNPGASQLSPGLIGYDGINSFGSVSYQVIKMFNLHRGDVVLGSEISGAVSLPYSVTIDTRRHLLFVKAVNTGNTPQVLQFALEGVKVAAGGEAWVLKSDSLDSVNTLTGPVKVAPEITALNSLGPNFAFTFPPYSATVLVLTVL